MNFTRLDKYKSITKEQADIYTVLNNMRLKEIVTWVIISAFVLVLLFLISLFIWSNSSWQEKGVVGILDGVLGGTMYPLSKHYFPALTKANGSEKKGNL